RAPPPRDEICGLVFIFVWHASGGGCGAACVAADAPIRRNIIRALILGTLLITVIYLAVNVAYLRALGFEKMRTSFAVAAEVGQMARGDQGSLAISLLVMVSVLGAINGLTYTGSRVYSTLGADHSIFAVLGKWSPTLGSPVWALMIQAGVVLAMIIGVGTPLGRDTIDSAVTAVGLARMP